MDYYVYHLDEYKFSAHIDQPHTFGLAFYLFVRPYIDFMKDRFRLSLWVYEEEKQVPPNLLSLSEPFLHLRIGSNEISPLSSDWFGRGSLAFYTSDFDPAGFSSWIGQNVTVHFNELHVRHSQTGVGKPVLLPPLELVTGKTIEPHIAVPKYVTKTPLVWVGLMITVAIYGSFIWFTVILIRSIMRRIRKRHSP